MAGTSTSLDGLYQHLLKRRSIGEVSPARKETKQWRRRGCQSSQKLYFWSQKIICFHIYKLLWVFCKLRMKYGSKLGFRWWGGAGIFLGRTVRILVLSDALNLGFSWESSNKDAVEQILQWCGSYIWKSTFTVLFHAPGLGDQHVCFYISGK